MPHPLAPGGIDTDDSPLLRGGRRRTQQMDVPSLDALMPRRTRERRQPRRTAAVEQQPASPLVLDNDYVIEEDLL
jgi:hypothetical protein